MKTILFVCGSRILENRHIRLRFAENFASSNESQLHLSVENDLSSEELHNWYFNHIHTKYTYSKHRNTYEEIKSVSMFAVSQKVLVCSNFWHIPRIWVLIQAHIPKRLHKNISYMPVWHKPKNWRYVKETLASEKTSYQRLWRCLKTHHKKGELHTSPLKRCLDFLYGEKPAIG